MKVKLSQLLILSIMHVFFNQNLQHPKLVEIAFAAEGGNPENPLERLREETTQKISKIEKKVEEVNRKFIKIKEEIPYAPSELKSLKERIERLQENLPIVDKKIAALAFEEFRIAGIMTQALIGVLALIIASVSVVGLVTYKVISNRLETQVGERVDERANYFFARLYLYLSYIHWREYEFVRPEDKLRAAYLDIAIEDAERALGVASRLDISKYEALTCSTKNHLAYHLATRKGSEDDRRRAYQLGKDVYQVSLKHEGNEDYEWYRLRETYVWVIMRLSEGNVDARNEAKNILSPLLKREDLPRSWREQIREKYRLQFGLDLAAIPR